MSASLFLSFNKQPSRGYNLILNVAVRYVFLSCHELKSPGIQGPSDRPTVWHYVQLCFQLFEFQKILNSVS